MADKLLPLRSPQELLEEGRLPRSVLRDSKAGVPRDGEGEQPVSSLSPESGTVLLLLSSIGQQPRSCLGEQTEPALLGGSRVEGCLSLLSPPQRFSQQGETGPDQPRTRKDRKPDPANPTAFKTVHSQQGPFLRQDTKSQALREPSDCLGDVFRPQPREGTPSRVQPSLIVRTQS